MSEEALQIAEERRKVKSKGKGERIMQLNVELQRIPRRAKKAFFNEQCKETGESNRREKIRDFFKKTGGIKGIFHAKMGTIKEKTVKT